MKSFLISTLAHKLMYKGIIQFLAMPSYVAA